MTIAVGKQTDPIIHQHQDNWQEIQTILHWQHIIGRDAHCLARLYTQNQCAIVILTELRSNAPGRDVGLDVCGAAKALLKTFELQLDMVTWIIHYGKFSYYEGSEREEFCQVSIHLHDGQCTSTFADDKTTLQTSVHRLLPINQLDAVPQVLQHLGWNQEYQK